MMASHSRATPLLVIHPQASIMQVMCLLER